MPRTLEALKNRLDEIEMDDEWAYNFVTSLFERFEEDPDYELSAKQRNKLWEIQSRYP